MSDLSSRHQKTLARIFEKPTRSDIEWKDIESLFKHLGAILKEGNGSRLRVALNGRKNSFHRPHPQKETNQPTVRDVCDFLKNAGVEP